MSIAAGTLHSATRITSWRADVLSGARALTLSQPLPSQVGTTIVGNPRALCIAPGEWLLLSSQPTAVTQPHDAIAVRAEPVDASSDVGLVVVDLTHSFAGLHISGPGSEALITKGCALDLHRTVFPAGRCARTRLADIPVIVECCGDPRTFVLHVARSYLDYLVDWLIDAAEPLAVS